MRVLSVVIVAGVVSISLGLQQPASRSSSAAPPAPPARSHAIPDRPADAIGGAAFVRRIVGRPRAERQAAIVAEVLRGNVPDFLRRLRPVTLRRQSPSGVVRATVWVMPDYLAIGSDDDFVRVPVDFYSAVAIAREFGMSLPTRKIVDAVYTQAAVRLRPQTMTPGPTMGSATYFDTHNRRIESQRAGRALGQLTAGHKKDLVITNRLARQRTPRVAIYGWHRGPGDPIQPLSTVHGATYADYSHGLRLVGGIVVVNGDERDTLEALQDARLAAILTLEGPIRLPQQLRTAAGR